MADKTKTCCGCSCLASILVVIAIVVSSYFGFNFLHSKGKEFAAISFEKTIKDLTEQAFDKPDQDEIRDKASLIAQKILTGEIGLTKLIKEGSQQLEGSLLTKSMALAFMNKYLRQGEAGGGKGVGENKALVNKLIYGLHTNKIRPAQIASVTTLLVENFSEKINTSGGKDINIKLSSKRLKLDLNEAQITQCLEMIKGIVDQKDIKLPENEFSPANAIKKDILKIFSQLEK